MPSVLSQSDVLHEDKVAAATTGTRNLQIIPSELDPVDTESDHNQDTPHRWTPNVASIPNAFVIVKNRRWLYLQSLGAAYYERPYHAFYLPELYQQLIARFMTAREVRDKAATPGTQRKFSELLARDLEKGEDRLAAAHRRREDTTTTSSSLPTSTSDHISVGQTSKLKPLPEEIEEMEAEDTRLDSRSDDDEDDKEELVIPPGILLLTNSEGNFNSITDREEAWDIWCDILRQRFLRGEDSEIIYDEIDEGQGSAEIEREMERDKWDEWFDDDEGEEDEDMVERNNDTGVQDY